MRRRGRKRAAPPGPAAPGADREAGNAAVELAPVTLVFIALLVLIIAAGRITTARLAVLSAARDAARQASIARSPATARSAAQSAALAALRSNSLDCDPAVSVSTAGFAVPVGQPAQVSVTVSCTVSLAGLTLPGVPGYRTIARTFTSPLDPFRARALGPSPSGPLAGAGPGGGQAW